MKTNHNELPEVNQYIKEHKLTPHDVEITLGSSYKTSDDITYLFVFANNTYVSYSLKYTAELTARDFDGLLVVCRGKIKNLKNGVKLK